MAEQTQEPQMKFLFESEEQIFSLLEESDFFRMKVGKSEVKEDHVEEFMDKTVEWLSTNPKKGILIDLEGVKSVCSDFTVALTRYYENINGGTIRERDPRFNLAAVFPTSCGDGHS
jgi:hypothetical protein